MSDRTLAISGLKKSFGGVEALRGANLTCEGGETHALIGENGAGKSTLVKVLSGAVRADAGEMLLDGEPLAVGSPSEARDAGIATVFQELSLIPDLPRRQQPLLRDRAAASAPGASTAARCDARPRPRSRSSTSHGIDVAPQRPGAQPRRPPGARGLQGARSASPRS